MYFNNSSLQQFKIKNLLSIKLYSTLTLCKDLFFKNKSQGFRVKHAFTNIAFLLIYHVNILIIIKYFSFNYNELFNNIFTNYYDVFDIYYSLCSYILIITKLLCGFIFRLFCNVYNFIYIYLLLTCYNLAFLIYPIILFIFTYLAPFIYSNFLDLGPDYISIVRLWAVSLTIIYIDLRKSYDMLYEVHIIIILITVMAWIYLSVLCLVIWINNVGMEYIECYNTLMVPDQNLYWFDLGSGEGGFGPGPSGPTPPNPQQSGIYANSGYDSDEDKYAGVPNLAYRSFLHINTIPVSASNILNCDTYLVDCSNQIYLKDPNSHFNFIKKGYISNNDIFDFSTKKKDSRLIGRIDGTHVLLNNTAHRSGIIWYDNRLDPQNQIVPLSKVNPQRYECNKYKLEYCKTKSAHQYSDNSYKHVWSFDKPQYPKLFIGSPGEIVSYTKNFSWGTEIVYTKANTLGNAHYVGITRIYPDHTYSVFRKDAHLLEDDVTDEALLSSLRIKARLLKTNSEHTKEDFIRTRFPNLQHS